LPIWGHNFRLLLSEASLFKTKLVPVNNQGPVRQSKQHVLQ
jgi:hypothetical protein